MLRRLALLWVPLLLTAGAALAAPCSPQGDRSPPGCGTHPPALRLSLWGRSAAILPLLPPREDRSAPPITAGADLLARTLLSDGHALATSPARWGRREGLLAGATLASVALLFALDEEVRGEIAGEEALSGGLEEGVEPLGRIRTVQGISLGLYAAGHLLGRDDLKVAGLRGAEASLFTSALVGGIKIGVGRERPIAGKGSGSFRPFGGPTSFPSSHASQSASLAAVLARLYGPRVGVPALAIAAVVGLARMAEDLHWSSDVAAGAAIGLSIGWSLAGRESTGSNPSHRSPNLTPGG